MAWPADAAWVSLTEGGAPITDAVDLDAADAHLDLADDAGSVVQFTADDGAIYIRVHVAADPSGDGVWGVMLDLDRDETADLELAVVNGTIEAWDDTRLATYGDRDSDEVRSTPASAGFWLELQIPRDLAAADLGIEPTTSFGVLPYTGAVDHASRADLPLCVAADCDPLWFSDPIGVDQDDDGLPIGQEWALGLNPWDADCDDDGLLDGLEALDDLDADYAIGALDCDSDADGLVDGTEAGVDLASPYTAYGGCFIADLDPSSTTDPQVADSDGGGLADGLEDWNHNGALDPWETDPTDPTDDVDTDADGIPDRVEGTGDTDGDGTDDSNDLDADGDGRPDSVEGARDADGDGAPNYLDLDADGDTVPDADESDEATDGGRPNWEDSDSDGDGQPDGDEWLADVDCDGLNDAVDADETNGDCDPDDIPGGDTDDPDTDVVTPFTGGEFGGGSCSSAGSWTSLGWIAALAVFARRRRTPGRPTSGDRHDPVVRGTVALSAAVPVGIAALAVVAASPALAQDVDVDRVDPRPDGSVFTVLHDPVGRPLPGISLVGSVIDDPLVYRVDDRETAVVHRLATLTVGGFFDAGPVRISGSLPVGVIRNAWDPEAYAADPEKPVWGLGPALGDARATVALPLVNRDGSAMQVYLEGTAPTGGDWVGEDRPTVALGASTRKRLPLGSSALYLAADLYGRTGGGGSLGDMTAGPLLGANLGLAFEAMPTSVALELRDEVWLTERSRPGGFPAEVTISAAHRLPSDIFAVRVGVGTGIGNGVGNPDWRAFAGLQVGKRAENHD